VGERARARSGVTQLSELRLESPKPGVDAPGYIYNLTNERIARCDPCFTIRSFCCTSFSVLGNPDLFL
jgi:hypothetical protein